MMPRFHQPNKQGSEDISPNQIKEIRSSLIDGYYQQLKREGYSEEAIVQLVSEAIATAEWKLNESISNQDRDIVPAYQGATINMHANPYYQNSMNANQFRSTSSFSQAESENAMPPMESYFSMRSGQREEEEEEQHEGMSSFNCSPETTPVFDEHDRHNRLTTWSLASQNSVRNTAKHSEVIPSNPPSSSSLISQYKIQLQQLQQQQKFDQNTMHHNNQFQQQQQQQQQQQSQQPEQILTERKNSSSNNGAHMLFSFSQKDEGRRSAQSSTPKTKQITNPISITPPSFQLGDSKENINTYQQQQQQFKVQPTTQMQPSNQDPKYLLKQQQQQQKQQFHVNNFTQSQHQRQLSNEQHQQHSQISNNQKQQNNLAAQKVQLSQLKEQLRVVFMFYVSFGDRGNVSHLRSQKFHKMMLDAELVDQNSSHLTKNALDLMFVKEIANKHIMDFDSFLNLVIAIARVKFASVPQHDALSLILQYHFIPLYENILHETELGSVELLHKQPIERETLELLRYSHQLLSIIYQSYFVFEWRGVGESREVINKSEQALLKFLKEFDLCPALMTKSSAFLLFHQILETNESDLTRNLECPNLDEFLPAADNQGNYFTYFRFATAIIRLASICYINIMKSFNSNPPAQPTQMEQFNILLDRMQISQGYLELNIKPIQSTSILNRSRNLSKEMSRMTLNNTSSTHANSTHLSSQFSQQSSSCSAMAPSHSMLQRSTSEVRISRDSQSQQQSSQQYQVLRGKSPSQSGSNTIRRNNEEAISVLVKSMRNFKLLKCPSDLSALRYAENVLVLDSNIDSLMKVFTTYCSFGDAMNTSSMTSAKFSKLVKEAKIVAQQPFSNTAGSLSQSDIELMFIKATKKPNLRLDKQKGRLSFENFIVCLEMIADKAMPQYAHNGLSVILDTYIFPLIDSITIASRRTGNGNGNTGKDHNGSEFNHTIDESGEFYVATLMEILKDSEVVELLKYVHRALLPSFKVYSENKGTLSFEKFARFAKDFGIFPDIMPKSRLLKMFNTLSQIYNTAVQPTSQSVPPHFGASNKLASNSGSSTAVIDEHLFAESVALISCEIIYASPEYQPCYAEKICNLIVRMNQSATSNSIAKHIANPRSFSCFDITLQIRKKFPQYFSGLDTITSNVGNYNNNSSGNTTHFIGSHQHSKSSRYSDSNNSCNNQQQQQQMSINTPQLINKNRSVSSSQSSVQIKKYSQFDEMILRNLNQ